MQPVVSVVDEIGNRVFSFNGTAYITLDASPSGFGSLYLGQDCDMSDNCGDIVEGRNTPATIINGQASFAVSLCTIIAMATFLAESMNI